MAVAAYSGSLTVYSLKPMAQLKAEVEGPEGLLSDRFLPISSVSTQYEHGHVRNNLYQAIVDVFL